MKLCTNIHYPVSLNLKEFFRARINQFINRDKSSNVSQKAAVSYISENYSSKSISFKMLFTTQRLNRKNKGTVKI